MTREEFKARAAIAFGVATSMVSSGQRGAGAAEWEFQRIRVTYTRQERVQPARSPEVFINPEAFIYEHCSIYIDLGSGWVSAEVPEEAALCLALESMAELLRRDAGAPDSQSNTFPQSGLILCEWGEGGRFEKVSAGYWAVEAAK